jgi:HEAT repeats
MPKRSQYISISLAILGLCFLLFFVIRTTPLHPSLNIIISRSFPGLIPSNSYVRNLYSPDTQLVLEGLYYLAKRRDPVAVPRAIDLLKSNDDYVWLNAARYLGACKRPEAVPYLIKALRHTAWRDDAERIQYLRDITGLDFGADFTRWQQWWLSSHPDAQFDWVTHLGPNPRLRE